MTIQLGSKSNYKRRDYIRLKMIDLLLHDLLPAEEFGIVWDLIDKMDAAGATHYSELAENEYYKKAVASWIRAKKIRRQRFIESKSL